MALQEDKKQTDSEIAKQFLSLHYPDTVYGSDEKETYATFESEARKNMFLQAVRDGEIEIALKLILYDLVNVSVFDGYGNTALHYSCYFNQLKLMDFILKCNNIDINQINTSKATPLHLASEMKNIKCVTKLINANDSGYELDINAKNSNNWTALHFACFVNIETIKVSLKQKNKHNYKFEDDEEKSDEIDQDLLK